MTGFMGFLFGLAAGSTTVFAFQGEVNPIIPIVCLGFAQVLTSLADMERKS